MSNGIVRKRGKSMLQVIDLSQELAPGMVVYPGSPQPQFRQVATIESDGYREMMMTLCTHHGTHLDAPAHLIAGGLTVDQLAPASFVGEALVLDFTRPDTATVDVQDLRPYEAIISGHDFVLLHTGWSKFWGDRRYFADYPVLSEAAARWLVAAGLRGVGVDTMSVDAPAAAGLPVHRLLLAGGLVIVENLNNLAALPHHSFFFSCLPLRLKDGDGSPVRAVALLS
ncbi:Kynurenine formamidase [Desulfofustis glycolicus DSM 9705]|uniref:Kynurenine formamidase n=2 Tax=Desulfofustis glycolicus TaxID=51195 RepID=A0A1M5V5X5_9BACT|nr:Kynurenine formamidase [Desulfofustis glycolicus DSM 9705]